MIEYERLHRHALSAVEETELEAVDTLAPRLRDHLTARSESITQAHVHGAKSSVIQEVVAELLLGALDFEHEVVLTPQQGFVTQARPDFFFPLPGGSGVIAEVERGGTVNNNHDLKDLWKTHVAPNAQHLFLIVPISNWKQDGSAREKPFVRVVARMRAFFGDARREIDVTSVHVFGY